MIDFAALNEKATGREQGDRARKMWSAVVLVALDDAIKESNTRYPGKGGKPFMGDGQKMIRNWANSRDGREVLDCAGITHSKRTVDGMAAFVAAGVRTSQALARG